MISVVGLYLPINDKFLVTQRSYGPLKGLWEFPGGKIERGEGIFDAIKREIIEELGVTVKPLSKISRFSHTYPFDIVMLTLIKCELDPMVQTVQLNGSHAAYDWIDENDSEKEFAPLDKKIMDYLKKYKAGKQL